MRVTQRHSQCYMEKRRGRRELEVTRMRWGAISRGESGLASNHFLMCTPQLDRSEMFTELYREEKKEQGDRGGQKDKRGEWKGGRQIQPVISSQNVLHSPEYTKRFTEWVGKKRVREEIEATWWRKRRVKRGRAQSRQWSNSQVEMGSEDWVLKCTKLTTNTKKQILKVYSKG